MKQIIAVLIFFISSKSLAQYKIRDASPEQDQPSGILTKNQILLVSLIESDYKIKYSVDKVHWQSRVMENENAIEIKLDGEFAYFFVLICNKHLNVDCVTYKLKPKFRYAIAIDSQSGDVVIKSGN